MQMINDTDLMQAWDDAAALLDVDPMRPVRYGKCFRYLCNIDRHSKIVEVGCGEGTGLEIAKRIGFDNIVGVEVSKERIRKAKLKFNNQLTLFLFSPNNYFSFKDNSFDIAVSAAVIEHTINPRDFVKELARIVRPGGYIIISSDCYQWRILQLLGIYKSTQPIDRAIFPINIFGFFRDAGLRIIHYEGFCLPGQEFRFMRMIFNPVLHLPIVRLSRRYIQRIIKILYKKIQSISINSGISIENDTIEKWKKRKNIFSFLRIIFSDENVFFLVKE